jgi:hypothetical protein
VLRTIRSGRVRLAGHATPIGEVIEYSLAVGQYGERLLGDLGVDRRVVLAGC